MDMRDLQERYGVSEHGNYRVIETIGIPHPYCITAKHVAVASDHHGGTLGRAAIEDAEKRGAKCGICHGRLSYDAHETALLVECKAPLTGDDGKAMPELHEYLLKSKPLCEEDHFAGFAFKEG